jgi:AraC-like DNA-binding protein
MAHSRSPRIDLAALAKRGDAGYIASHLHVTVVGADVGMRFHRARCSCRESGFEARELTPAPKLVFVERGAFWRRTRTSKRTLVDVGFAYFAGEGGEEEFAHPNDGGDVTALLEPAPSLAAEITGGDLRLPERPVPIDARTHRVFRSLTADAEDGPVGAWVELGIDLIGGLALANRAVMPTARRAAARVSHRRLVEGAREALIADPGLGVTDLARAVGCSPFHLSRVFRRETETTISEYRLRLRVREALARIGAGEENLARLAADLGFSDHSHLTRLLVRELGETPTAIRRSSR